MATRKPARKSVPLVADIVPESGVERALHTACVKAGAAAALQVTLDRLPMLKPFLPRSVTEAGRGDAPERLQRLLVKQVYARYHLRPADWEVDGIQFGVARVGTEQRQQPSDPLYATRTPGHRDREGRGGDLGRGALCR
jgi:hypothetical protein